MSSAITKKGDEFVHPTKDGRFERQVSKFRSTIPSKAYPAEAGRYVLYLNYGCPWAQRSNIVRTLKGLEDIVELIEVDGFEPGPNKGWYFSGVFGPEKDPLNGVKYLRELYLQIDPGFNGRATVPTLWDKTTKTIVNNESSEIIRMFYTAFDHLLPTNLQESSKGHKGLRPAHLETEIDTMNEWVYNTVNNGVYKCGFATSQESYEEAIYPLFESLDRLEEHLADPKHIGPYLFGEDITDADIRLYPTIVRFDITYYMLFKLNIKMIRHDYPRLYQWLRTLYWDESDRTRAAFKNTTLFDRYKFGFKNVTGEAITPVGPIPVIHDLEYRK